ncbi:hypothetical protein [Kamptonema sp. UHCC 0994]|uniref:hypothetical protein n=1 Tax=Kamptonema sp. UHCC 0994 TaxID=3031329 RepID=UPI0023B9F68C|nr:hypothetical protein [Kamptonema sp. UHCC 0994]MDF0553141.1 hypothetical protein [Kamptonema sp. UHCC 0994]
MSKAEDIDAIAADAIAVIESAMMSAIEKTTVGTSVAISPLGPSMRGMIRADATITVGCRRVEYSNLDAAKSGRGLQNRRAKANFTAVVEAKDLRTHLPIYTLLNQVRAALNGLGTCLCEASPLTIIEEEFLGLTEGLWSWGQTYQMEFVTDEKGNGIIDDCGEREQCFRIGKLRLFAVTSLNNKPGVLVWSKQLPDEMEGERPC